MAEILKELDENTKEAVSKVAAEFKYAKDLDKELEKIEGEEDPAKGVKEVRNAIRILRWIGRAERKVDVSEKKILSNLEELGEILPPKLKSTDEKLAQKLEVAEKKLVELASMFTGKVKDELEDIKTDEALLKRYEDNPEQAEKVKHHLSALLKETETHVDELLKWISSTEAILKSIQGFEETLERLAGGA